MPSRLQLGSHELPNHLFVAPMAGVTDRPFRQLCRRMGAGYAVSEMVTSRKDLWDSLKTSRRADHQGEAGPIAVQIAGTDALMMAEAATYNIDRGAQIIDINMGCPAKKVCSKWAGSALMQDEPLALQIIEAVVAAAAPRNVPVTLKMRTGWCETEKNALRLALAAENAGVAMVTVHGRTREQGYKGQAEYATAAAVKAALRIPVAQGRPWIFREIAHYLATGETLPAPAVLQAGDWLTEHLHDHYSLYGELTGMRTARKHIGWAVSELPGGEEFRQMMNRLQSCAAQLQALKQWFSELADRYERLPYLVSASQEPTMMNNESPRPAA
jgi:tRNA-dihydrouridine synthase B